MAGVYTNYLLRFSGFRSTNVGQIVAIPSRREGRAGKGDGEGEKEEEGEEAGGIGLPFFGRCALFFSVVFFVFPRVSFSSGDDGEREKGTPRPDDRTPQASQKIAGWALSSMWKMWSVIDFISCLGRVPTHFRVHLSLHLTID